jgi:hypothetical protein
MIMLRMDMNILYSGLRPLRREMIKELATLLDMEGGRNLVSVLPHTEVEDLRENRYISVRKNSVHLLAYAVDVARSSTHSR